MFFIKQICPFCFIYFSTYFRIRKNENKNIFLQIDQHFMKKKMKLNYLSPNKLGTRVNFA